MSEETKKVVKNSMVFVIFMGIVSLLSDCCHEGAKSIYGTFLKLPEVGGTAFLVSFISGFGEFVGTALILLTGYIANKTHKYWLMTLIGYITDVVVIPLLALTWENGWLYACILIVLERVGRAIRKPAKSTLVSFASKNMGEGKTFAWLEFLDQIGAFLGPLILTFTLMSRGNHSLYDSYRFCFLVLGIPGVLCVLFLIFSYVKFPHPENFERDEVVDNTVKKVNLLKQKSFVFYIVAICLVAFGFVDFPLISVYIQDLKIIDDNYLPLAYSLAMLIDAFSALAFGYAYDHIHIKALIIATAISAFFPLFLFLSNNFTLIVIGIVLWGIGMGAEESILKAAVATLVDKNNRSLGFGIFEAFFGLFWFLGSTVLGYLYGINMYVFAFLSFGIQMVSIPFFGLSIKASKKEKMLAQV